MALESGDVLGEGRKEPIQEAEPGRRGGLLSSRRSRALLDKVLEEVDVDRTKVPVAKQARAIHEIEVVLKEAQGKRADKIQGQPLDVDDKLVGTPCPSCHSKLMAEEMVVKAKDGATIHVRCAGD